MNKKKPIISMIGIIFLIVIYNFYTTFSLTDDYKFTSEVYTINETTITNISPNTDLSLFIDYFDIDNCTISVTDINDKELTKGIIPNNSKTVVKQNNQVVATYTNIIVGDITKNGLVNEEDLLEFGKYLIERPTITEELKQSIDIDNKDNIHLNDLMLLDKAITNGYESMTISKDEVIVQEGEKERVVANISPSYGLDKNVNWTSQNNNIATVSSSGIITGIKEGETIIEAKTKDGTITETVKVTVDNTIKLEYYSGNVYQESDGLVVGIKSVDYNGITCTSSNESAITCEIKNKNLYLHANESGTSNVTITSPIYGSKVFKATSVSTYINLQYSDYSCLNTNQKGTLFISTINAGTLSFDISDEEIIEYAYSEGRYFYFKSGQKTGRGEVIIKGTNSNKTKKFTLDVYKFSIPSIGGVGYIGEEFSTDIISENTGTITCTSSDETIAMCRIEGNKLYIQGLKKGQATINVTNTMVYEETTQKCGTASFLAVIQER